MDLVYELFVKLGLRYICILRDGKYAGMVSSYPLTPAFLPGFVANEVSQTDTQKDVRQVHA
ncbi:hypothetical protein B0T20DRAFT_421947 [Sordaria brevicollis]|uniref:Uncharacterized protein n=1 Tax=Sordaria brevicollis TaxID=83679 RepID=A0AAE0U5H8_SORBR|nr:hypothetical protein B0T20DRAFT_421947 [Sordaria brevicollis]